MNRTGKMVFTALALTALMAGACGAQSWLGVLDGYGCTWARMKIVNLSPSDVYWTFNNCRTAVSSSAGAAETDALKDWDGAVPAGEARYVWIYGLLSGDIEVATAGGTEHGYLGYIAPDYAGDGELVLTVDENGEVTAAIESAVYSVPALSGTLPDMSIEEEEEED